MTTKVIIKAEVHQADKEVKVDVLYGSVVENTHTLTEPDSSVEVYLHQDCSIKVREVSKSN